MLVKNMLVRNMLIRENADQEHTEQENANQENTDQENDDQEIRRPHRGQQAVRCYLVPPSVPPSWDSGGAEVPPPVPLGVPPCKMIWPSF